MTERFYVHFFQNINLFGLKMYLDISFNLFKNSQTFFPNTYIFVIYGV